MDQTVLEPVIEWVVGGLKQEATGPMTEIIQHIRKAVLLSDGAGLTDGQLLECFISRREQAALAALVRRHSPMVWGVCRRVLFNHHDAEDAFQATFLVLVRRAASIVPQEMVANWLYGVAHQTALKARETSARRRLRERQLNVMPEVESVEQNRSHVLQHLFDQELSRLPDKHRAVIVLCDLEQRRRKEAAQQLGVPEGTVASRLARARTMLARRLTRAARRLVPPGLVLAPGALAALPPAMASARVPKALAAMTIKTATVSAVSTAMAAEMIPAAVAGLTQEVLRAMTQSKIKNAMIAVLLLLAAVAIGLPAYRALAAVPASVQEIPPAGGELALARATVLLASAQVGDQPVRGSGKEATKEFKLADFTMVDVAHVIHVDITRGDTFRVVATADDNLLEFVKVVKDGATLRISLDGGKESIQNGKWKVAVTMPKLAGVSASHASRVTFKEFKGAGEFKARAHGASHVKGEIETAKLDLQVDEASMATLRGSSKDAKLTGTGASQLRLADFAVDNADVHLKGASSAKIKVKQKLDYDLSGASHLQYQGDPSIGKKKTAGASSASHKGK